jgi:ABC-type bacteriocin/lantibiotic exporter with double-glycine peptidase domain
MIRTPIGSTRGSRLMLRLPLLVCLCSLWDMGTLWAADGSNGPRRDPYGCCGLNCLAVLAHSWDIHVPLSSIEELVKPRENGDCSVSDIERAAKSLGLHPVSAHVDWNTLPDVPFPCIVQLRSPTRYATGSHYALLMALHRSGVILLDAPNPAMLHPYDEFRRDFTGVVVAFPRDEKERRVFVARVTDSPSWAGWIVRGSILVSLGVLAWFLHRWRPSRAMKRPSAAPVADA